MDLIGFPTLLTFLGFLVYLWQPKYLLVLIKAKLDIAIHLNSPITHFPLKLQFFLMNAAYTRKPSNEAHRYYPKKPIACCLFACQENLWNKRALQSSKKTHFLLGRLDFRSFLLRLDSLSHFHKMECLRYYLQLR